ncbi:MAG: hypothetical protein ACRDRL_22200 [Sciscionella sp.]
MSARLGQAAARTPERRALTARAAINYQHAADGRDQEIAAALDKLIKKEQGRGRARAHRGTRKPPKA